MTAERHLGRLLGLGALVKGLPLAYNSDLQEDKPPLFEAARTTRACLAVLAKMLPKLRVQKKRMREAAGGFSLATELADYVLGFAILDSLIAMTIGLMIGVPILVGYGLTEGTAFGTLNAGEELSADPESVGRPVPIVDVEVRDENDRPVADGVEGEIHLRGPLVMLEYWNDPGATAAAIKPGRWLNTGDVGRLQDGKLYIASRKRDLILRGGENVYCAEVESTIYEHPAVAECAVIGMSDELKGQVPIGFVERQSAGTTARHGDVVPALQARIEAAVVGEGAEAREAAHVAVLAGDPGQAVVDLDVERVVETARADREGHRQHLVDDLRHLLRPPWPPGPDRRGDIVDTRKIVPPKTAPYWNSCASIIWVRKARSPRC